MIIRQMVLKDLDKVCEIEKQLFGLPWSYQSFKNAIEDKNNIYLTAKQQENIVGYCGLWEAVGEGQITNVAVKREFWNQKIATSLLSELIRIGKLKKIKAFTLEVRESNQYAIKLYKNFGFQICGIRKNFYEKPKEDAFVMWLQ